MPVDKRISQQFDVVVVGAGLVGMSCALALRQSGLAVGLVEARQQSMDPPTTDDRDWDSRIYAISPTNAEWLAAMGVWSRMVQNRVCPISQMRIFGDSPEGRLRFDANEACIENLGYIIENRQLEYALSSAIKDAGVHLVMGQQSCAVEFHDRHTVLEFIDGSQCEASLLIAADGANSWLRGQAGIGTISHDYHQLGVVANFKIEKPHHGIAYQWFGDLGILAWLPLPGNRMSMVWSAEESFARELLELSPESLSEKVARQGGMELGALHCITPAKAFPLRQQTAGALVRPLLALVGDAAHTVHPLAGQGVNLGFEDARVLSETLAARRAMQSIGDWMLLRCYERARKRDVLEMQCVTRGLNALFEHSGDWTRRLRNLGLDLTDRQARLKKYLIHQAIR